ncbi:hypothetical protein AKJ42_03750, partial [candidate division MSBL1 archaeon SCGC-AAA261C02]
APFTTGGRRAHPPKAEQDRTEKINKKAPPFTRVNLEVDRLGSRRERLKELKKIILEGEDSSSSSSQKK